MKPRSTLNAAEASALVDYLLRRLDGVGLTTQPEVATKILTLISDPDAGMKDYADAIRTDATLAGRLLRLANSAFFAQRQPVTNVERACVLLGLERLKAVSCGFYLSRAAVADPTSKLSRRIWGESLLRACLMSELARAASPGLVPEAFIVGLMLDAGVPLLAKWLGPPAEAILADELFPRAQHDAEFKQLPYTHVDVVAALARLWKLPDLLAKPIERHHIEPGSRTRGEPVHQLHRLAYCVGSLRLDVAESLPPLEMPGSTEKILGVDSEGLRESVRRAVAEYGLMRDMFRDLASVSGDPSNIADRAHQQLVAVMDETMVSHIQQESQNAPASFSIAGHRVEIESDEAGQAVAYLNDTRGRRLLSHAFRPGEQDARSILDALGIEHSGEEQTRDIDMYLRSLAA